MYRVIYFLSRSIGGYVLFVPWLILYFALLHKFRKGQKPTHIVLVFLFAYYLFAILTAAGIGNTKSAGFSPELHLVPFRDMFAHPIHDLLNVAAFVPMGFILPLLYRAYRCGWRTALTGFLFSLSVECLQMFGWGATEIDDLITNTVGVCLGYGIYLAVSKVVRKDFEAVHVRDAVETLALSAGAFLVMTVVQPMIS